MRRRSSRPFAFALLFGALVATGCLAPPVEGPQLVDPPPRFGFDTNCGAARSPIPGANPIAQRCYFRTFGDDGDSVIIHRYERSLTMDTILEAHETYVDKWVHCKEESRYCSEASDLEPLEVAGQSAWGYSIVTHREGEETPSDVDYIVLLPWEEGSFAIEVHGNYEPFLEVASARELATRFDVRYTSDLIPIQIGAALAAIVLGFLAYRWLSRQKRKPEDGERELVCKTARPAPAPAPSAAAGDTRPPLPNPAFVVGAARRRFASDPAGAVAELEELRARHAPQVDLLHLLMLARLHMQEWNAALDVAREAWPLFLEEEGLSKAVDAYATLGQHALTLPLDTRQKRIVADGVLARGIWQTASHIYSGLLEADPNDRAAAAALIRVAENRARTPEGASDAAQLYTYVASRSKDAALVERAHMGIARCSELTRG